MIARLAESQFLRFLVTGGIAAAVNFFSRWLMTPALGYRWSIVAAYLCGMSTAWVLSRLFVFTASGRSCADEYLRFALVNVVAAAQVWAVSVGLADHVFPWAGITFHPQELAHGTGVILPVFTSYLGHKHFSFACKEKAGCGAAEAPDLMSGSSMAPRPPTIRFRENG